MRRSATALALKKAILVGAVACALPVMLNGCGALLVAGGAGGAAAAQDSRGFSTMLYDETIEQESYKILKNDGEFRHDIPSGGEVPLIFEIVTTGAGTADELTLIKDVYKYTDISGE